jgi:hypothetical protein
MNFKSTRRLAATAGLLCSVILSACATYQGKVDSARDNIKHHDYSHALEKLRPLAEKEDGDQLVYLLDYGTTLGLSGNYKDSNNILSKADRLADLVDYHSVSRIAGSLAISEEMVQYKGDTFEKIFINGYLAMNYLELNQLDDALVEARRLNEKYLKYRSDQKKKFELNPFGKYLSAMVWEANHEYDDAYIAYNEAYELESSIGPIREDLIRSAKLSRRTDTYKELKSKFPDVKEQDAWYDKKNGEIILIYQQGWGPRKVPSPGARTMPTLVPVASNTQEAQLNIDGIGSFKSREIYDVQRAAIETLKDDYGILLAKRIAAAATKEVAADQVRQKNELLGALTRIALYASDRADLRQWSTLPQTIQVVRVFVPAGKYKYSIQGLNRGGGPTGEKLENQEVEVKAGQKKFLIWRSLE